MENYIKKISTIIVPCIDHIQLVDYRDEELDFVYGMEEYHTSFRRMFKQIIRILWRKQKKQYT